jgi:hypothetical protein
MTTARQLMDVAVSLSNAAVDLSQMAVSAAASDEPRKKACDRPKTVAITYREGTDWVDFQDHRRRGRSVFPEVHSIKFSDGSIWDAINGWRS